MVRLAGVEIGGTKSIAVLAQDDRIDQQARIATTTPDATLSALRRQLREWNEQEALAALGVASFGPLQLDPRADDFGHILSTPKPSWSGAALLRSLAEGIACPVAIDTDVNAAALAELRWGAGQGSDSLCYVTIGTGVGGGLIVSGQPVHGALHPEIGHLQLRRAPDDHFAGACPFHADCIEGLISGPALAQRFGVDPSGVDAADPRWEKIAWDLAELCATIFFTTSAQRILIGGGVGLARAHVLPRAREMVCERLAGYLPFVDKDSVKERVQLAGLGEAAGPMGAIALALSALR